MGDAPRGPLTIHISAEAERDLERIGDHIAADHPARAASFLRELYAKCLTLGDSPERFPLVGRYEKLGVRRRVHGNYLIFYRIKADRIVILHVLHGAMDYAAILFDEDDRLD